MQADDRTGSWLQLYNMQVWGAILLQLWYFLSVWTAAVQVITQAFTFHSNLKCLQSTLAGAYTKSAWLMHVASCSGLGRHSQRQCYEAVRQRSSNE